VVIGDPVQQLSDFLDEKRSKTEAADTKGTETVE